MIIGGMAGIDRNLAQHERDAACPRQPGRAADRVADERRGGGAGAAIPTSCKATAHSRILEPDPGNGRFRRSARRRSVAWRYPSAPSAARLVGGSGDRRHPPHRGRPGGSTGALSRLGWRPRAVARRAGAAHRPTRQPARGRLHPAADRQRDGRNAMVPAAEAGQEPRRGHEVPAGRLHDRLAGSPTISGSFRPPATSIGMSGLSGGYTEGQYFSVIHAAGATSIRSTTPASS
jgi:hypothetical protein